MKATLKRSLRVGNSRFEYYTYKGYVITYTSFAGWFVHKDEPNDKHCLSVVEDLASAEAFIDKLNNI